MEMMALIILYCEVKANICGEGDDYEVFTTGLDTFVNGNQVTITL